MESQSARRVASFTRSSTGLAMILAPVVLAVGLAIHPPESPQGATLLQTVVDNADRWNLAHLLVLVGFVLFIPVILELMRLLRQRAPWSGLIGGALALVGVVGGGIILGADAVALSAFATVPADQRAGVVPGVQALLDFKALGPLILLFLCLGAGLLVLAIGLFVTRAAPRWACAAIGVGGVLLVAIVSDPILATGAGLLLLGLGPIGVRLLRQPDGESETVPATAAPTLA
jgi:hypothetical protein